MKLTDILKIKKSPEFSTATIEGVDIPLEMERHAISDIPYLTNQHIWEFYTVVSVINPKFDLLMSEVSKNRLTDGHFGDYDPKTNVGTAEYYYQKYSVQIDGKGEACHGSYSIYSFEIPSGNNANGGGTDIRNKKQCTIECEYSKGVISLEDSSKVILDQRFRNYIEEFSKHNRKSEINISYHLRTKADIMNINLWGDVPITANDVLTVAGVFSTEVSVFSALLQLHGKYLAQEDKPPVIVDNVTHWHYLDRTNYNGKPRPHPGYKNALKLDAKEERTPKNTLLKEPLFEKVKKFI